MLVEVRLKRHQGRRLPWRDIDNGKAYRGDLMIICATGGGNRHVEARLVLTDGKPNSLLPPFHEPMLTGSGADVFHLRGIERLELKDGVHGAAQEWRGHSESLRQSQGFKPHHSRWILATELCLWIVTAIAIPPKI